MNISIFNFSETVPQAHDYYEVTSSDPKISISGVIGQKMFEVFFGKVGSKNFDEDMKMVERFNKKLRNKNFGNEWCYLDETKMNFD